MLDNLVIFTVLAGVCVAWRLCAELRRIREAVESIAMSQTDWTTVWYNKNR